jgi:hypothetical protein
MSELFVRITCHNSHLSLPNTPNCANPRVEKLKQYPAFQALRAKAETHQCQFRVKETARLKQQGRLDEVLDSRTESAWNALVDCRRNRMNQHEAEEVALPNILFSWGAGSAHGPEGP